MKYPAYFFAVKRWLLTKSINTSGQLVSKQKFLVETNVDSLCKEDSKITIAQQFVSLKSLIAQTKEKVYLRMAVNSLSKGKSSSLTSHNAVTDE